MAQLYMEYAHGLRRQGSGLCGRMGSSIRIARIIAHMYYRYDREARYSA